MKDINNGLLYGLSYFTSLPFKVKYFEANGKFYQGVLYSLPLAGVILSVITILVYQLLPFDNIYNALLSSVIYIFLYGMLHLEAVADTIDGYYASLSSKNVYEIMHEPQIGALGAIGAFCFTFLVIVSISYCLYLEQFVVLVLALSLSRLTVWFGLEYDFHPKSLFVISLKQNYKPFYILEFVFFIPKYFTKYVLKKIKNQLGFLNGDILGFVIVLNEILFINIFLYIVIVMR